MNWGRELADQWEARAGAEAPCGTGGACAAVVVVEHEMSRADLTVRQHERMPCLLGARVTVAPASEGAVVLSRAAAPGGVVSAHVTNVSEGGLRLVSPVFIPKRCRLVVQVLPGVAEEGVVYGPGSWLAEVEVRVERVQMLDRTPNYYLGGAFTAKEGEEGWAGVTALVEHVKASREARGEAEGA